MNIPIYLIVGIFIFSLYCFIVEQNLLKKVIFTSVLQSSIILYYIIVVWNVSVDTPFYNGDNVANYVDPVPQVLMLTAIVVGFATTALSLSVVMRIKRKCGTIMYNELDDKICASNNTNIDNMQTNEKQSCYVKANA